MVLITVFCATLGLAAAMTSLPSDSMCAMDSEACATEFPPVPRTFEDIEHEEASEAGMMDVRLLQQRAKAAAVATEVASVVAETGRAAAEQGGQSVPKASSEGKTTDASGVSYDHNGRVCLLCGKPLAERVGDKIYTEFRTDCGNHSSSKGPSADSLQRPAAAYISLASTETVHTNGFCELNFAKSCVDAVANSDYMYWAKSLDLLSTDMKESAQWDARYCQLNGFLKPEFVALQNNFTHMRLRSQALCETKYKVHGIDRINFKDMMKMARYDDPVAPSQLDAETLAAWNCAMGDLGCDIAMCTYSFCEKQGGKLGLYGECDGWDPVNGMRVPNM